VLLRVLLLLWPCCSNQNHARTDSSAKGPVTQFQLLTTQRTLVRLQKRGVLGRVSVTAAAQNTASCNPHVSDNQTLITH
jgi:hypothetical protein